MFARTARLLLRPGFPEDAPALAAAIADEGIVRHLASAPWPYRMRDATAFLAAPRDPVLPTLLMFERTQGAPELVGTCSLGRRASNAVEIGYWVARPHWGRGLATEACTALIDIARTLGVSAIEGAHFVDNPASGRVLEKLGFAPRGVIAPRMSCARGEEYPARLMRFDLTARADGEKDAALAA